MSWGWGPRTGRPPPEGVRVDCPHPPRLRFPAGVDAEGLAAGRARITGEEWVDMGGELSDEEYNTRFKRHFGIDL
jgi:hypothetical protein